MLDLKQQQIQEVLSAGLSTLASISNSVAVHKSQIPKEVVNSVVKQAIEGANLLGDEFQSINGRRRYEMKKYLNPEYSSICTTQLATSEWLFGADLAENLKSSKATSSLMKSTMPRNNRFTPYSRPQYNQQGHSSSAPSLNFRRPLFNQPRASGQYYQRFQR